MSIRSLFPQKLISFLFVQQQHTQVERWEEGKKWDLQEQRLSGPCWRSTSSLSPTSPQAPCLVGDGAAQSHTYKQSPEAERNHAGCHHSLTQSPPSVRFNPRTDVPQMKGNTDGTHPHKNWRHIPSAACSSAATRHQMLRRYHPKDVQTDGAAAPPSLPGARAGIDRFKHNHLCLLDHEAGGRAA